MRSIEATLCPSYDGCLGTLALVCAKVHTQTAVIRISDGIQRVVGITPVRSELRTRAHINARVFLSDEGRDYPRA